MKTRSPRARKTNDGGASVSARQVFIVRLWRERRGKPIWLGQVQHVRTGQVAHTRGLKELVDYLASHLVDETESVAVKKTGLR